MRRTGPTGIATVATGRAHRQSLGSRRIGRDAPRLFFLNVVPLMVQSAERHRSVEPAALLAAPVFPLLSPLCL